MADILVTELRKALKSFLSSASDKEFSAFLSKADQGVYSKIDIPVAELHRRIEFTDASSSHFIIGEVTYVDIDAHKSITAHEVAHFDLHHPDHISDFPIAA